MNFFTWFPLENFVLLLWRFYGIEEGQAPMANSDAKLFITGSVHVKLDQENAKMEVTISDFDETRYNRCPIWEYEMTQIWGRCDLQGPH